MKQKAGPQKPAAEQVIKDNRMCLSSFMAAEYDDLPEPVRQEVQSFADVNIA